LATDPYARYLLHKPFWHDYLASADHFDMNRWGDGDSFLVNYIGHPLEGSISSNIFLQNDPEGRIAKFGKYSEYWHGRLKAMVWTAAYSAYFEIAPIFSEAAIGNEGGYTYVPGFGLCPCMEEPAHHYKPPTNNTGWVDFVSTSIVGLGWTVAEDAVEVEIVDRLAKGRHMARYNLLRAALTPSRTMSNFLAFRRPWYRYGDDHPRAADREASVYPAALPPAWKNEVGISVLSSHTSICRWIGKVAPAVRLSLPASASLLHTVSLASSTWITNSTLSPAVAPMDKGAAPKRGFLALKPEDIWASGACSVRFARVRSLQ
jgi:hypothetical protein